MATRTRRKSFSRKEIRRPDRFVQLASTARKYVQEKKKPLLAVIAGILVVAAAGWSWRTYTGYQNARAAEHYTEGLTAYHEGRFDAAIRAFELAREHSPSVYGPLALLYMANTRVAQGQPELALTVLEELDPQTLSEPTLRELALLNLGLTQEINNACDKSLEPLEAVIQSNGPFKQEALLAKARCNAKLNRFNEAIDSYRLYLSESANGDNSEIAIRIRELEERAAN